MVQTSETSAQVKYRSAWKRNGTQQDGVGRFFFKFNGIGRMLQGSLGTGWNGTKFREENYEMGWNRTDFSDILGDGMD